MAAYYVNNYAQTSGDHEVHKTGCQFMPGSKTFLGDHSTCHTAVAEARKFYKQSNGCYSCSRECHTT